MALPKSINASSNTRRNGRTSASSVRAWPPSSLKAILRRVTSSNRKALPLGLDRRRERRGDRRQNRVDVGTQRAQQRDRDDRNEAENECVLDQRLTLFPRSAGAKAGEEALKCEHLCSLPFLSRSPLVPTPPFCVWARHAEQVHGQVRPNLWMTQRRRSPSAHLLVAFLRSFRGVRDAPGNGRAARPRWPFGEIGPFVMTRSGVVSAD